MWPVFCSVKVKLKTYPMSTYTPKIDITQFGNVKKVRSENANGEIQLYIEKGLTDQSNLQLDQLKPFKVPTENN